LKVRFLQGAWTGSDRDDRGPFSLAWFAFRTAVTPRRGGRRGLFAARPLGSAETSFVNAGQYAIRAWWRAHQAGDRAPVMRIRGGCARGSGDPVHRCCATSDGMRVSPRAALALRPLRLGVAQCSSAHTEMSRRMHLRWVRAGITICPLPPENQGNAYGAGVEAADVRVGKEVSVPT
jgi:hypothetical protein